MLHITRQPGGDVFLRFTPTFTTSFTIHGLPGYNSILSSEIEANGGGGSPPLGGYKKYKKSLSGQR